MKLNVWDTVGVEDLNEMMDVVSMTTNNFERWCVLADEVRA